MTRELFAKAISRFIGGVVLMGLVLFLPAGTLAWPGAWLLMGILFVPMFLAGLFLMAKSPALLEKRLNVKEEEQDQRVVIALSGIMFLAAFVTAGLGVRFGWPMLPGPVSLAGALLFLLGYLLYAEVLRENAYLSRTVEVQEGQKVIDTGLYGIVRHPMYMATLLLFLSMPLVLGSFPAFLILLFYLPIIARRIKNEEEVLERGLAGYREYKQKVRWRLIPHIW